MTWVREILLFAAGITLFLFGMMRLSEEVQQYLSNVRIRQFFRLAVEKPLYGLVTGIVTTVLFQSSTATSVLVVGMVSAGLMSFYRSLAIILGADVGTTVTVQLVVWKVTEISPVIVCFGGMLWFFAREKWKKIGEDSTAIARKLQFGPEVVFSHRMAKAFEIFGARGLGPGRRPRHPAAG